MQQLSVFLCIPFNSLCWSFPASLDFFCQIPAVLGGCTGGVGQWGCGAGGGAGGGRAEGRELRELNCKKGQ